MTRLSEGPGLLTPIDAIPNARVTFLSANLTKSRKALSTKMIHFGVRAPGAFR